MIVYLVKQSVIELIRNKTILFLIITISFAVSVFGILFYSGYFAYSYYDVLGGEACRIEISLKPSTHAKKVSDIVESLTGLASEAVISIIASDGYINRNYVNGNTLPAIGKLNKLEKEQVLLGRYFQDNENTPVVLLSESCAAVLDIPDSPIGETITLDNIDFTIIGILFHAEYAYILPLDYYIENRPTTRISILYNRDVSQAEMRNIIKTFHEHIVEYSLTKQASPS